LVQESQSSGDGSLAAYLEMYIEIASCIHDNVSLSLSQCVIVSFNSQTFARDNVIHLLSCVVFPPPPHRLAASI